MKLALLLPAVSGFDKSNYAVYPSRSLFRSVESSASKVDISNLNHFVVTMKKNRRLASPDFVVQLTTLQNRHDGPLGFQLDLAGADSWVYTQAATQAKGIRGYMPLSVPAVKSACNGPLCDSLIETVDAGKGVQWNTRLWLQHSAHTFFDNVAGTVGMNRAAGFFPSFMLLPATDKMALVVNPPILAPYVCKHGVLHYVSTFQTPHWQVAGKVGMVDGLGVKAEIVIATTGPLEIPKPAFEEFRVQMTSVGAELVHVDGFQAYQVANCAHFRSRFPSIGFEIGGFAMAVTPGSYVYTSSKLGHYCFIDVVPSKTGVARMGPAALRDIVTSFEGDRVGFCHKA